jgi:hypothetical protein
MARLVKRNGPDAAMPSGILVDEPGIEGGIRRDVGRVAVQGHDRALVEGARVGHIVLVERLGKLSQHDIAVVGGDGGGHAGAVAPQILLDLFGRAIGLLLIGAALDTQLAVGVAAGLPRFVRAVFDVLARVVLFDPGVAMLDIEGDRFAQVRDFGL